jgi:peroxiredoxin Q/BCP
VKSKIKFGLPALVLFCIAVSLIIPMVKKQSLRVGDKAPDFSLPDNKGGLTALSDFKGKKNVVLFFYPKNDTKGCTAEACRFRDEYEDFLSHDTEVLGISSDSVSSHERFAGKHGFSYPLLSDAGGKVRESYAVEKTWLLIPGRVTFVIDKQGVIRHVFNSQFNPEKHIDEALNIIKSL